MAVDRRLNGPLPADQGIARCQDALKRADGNGMVEAFALVERAALEAMRGEFDTARTLLADGRAIFRELDLNVFGANTSQEAFFVEMLAGNPEGAAAELRATYDLLEEMGERGFLSTIAGYPRGQRLCGRRFRGESDTVRPRLAPTMVAESASSVLRRSLCAKPSREARRNPSRRVRGLARALCHRSALAPARTQVERPRAERSGRILGRSLDRGRRLRTESATRSRGPIPQREVNLVAV